MHNTALIEKVLELNKTSQLPELGMLYGSKNEGSDVDVFLIFANIPIKKSIGEGVLDLNQIGYKDFLFKLGNWDLEYTEPILTGDYLFGNKEILEKSKEFLRTNKPDEQSLDYLGKRSLETYLQAETVCAAGKNELFNELLKTGEKSNSLISKLLGKNNHCFESSQILKSLSVLSYTLSYMAAHDRYCKGEGVTTLNQIFCEQDTEIEKELARLVKYFKTKNENKQKIKIPEIDGYFARTKNLLSQRSY